MLVYPAMISWTTLRVPDYSTTLSASVVNGSRLWSPTSLAEYSSWRQQEWRVRATLWYWWRSSTTGSNVVHRTGPIGLTVITIKVANMPNIFTGYLSMNLHLSGSHHDVCAGPVPPLLTWVDYSCLCVSCQPKRTSRSFGICQVSRGIPWKWNITMARDTLCSASSRRPEVPSTSGSHSERRTTDCRQGKVFHN